MQIKQLYGLVGHPVTGSKSPWLHSQIYETLGLNGAYFSFEVAPEQFAPSIEALKAVGAKGFNVTIPYKSDIMALLDQIDPYALALGAVNTVALQNGQWVGYNTDGPGLVAVLKRHMGDLSGKKVLVLGAGGAARGIVGALLGEPLSALAVYNRTPSKAKALVDSLLVSDLNLDRVHFYALDEALGSEHETPEPKVIKTVDLSPFDLIINTTAVGMAPNVHAIPLALDGLRPGAFVCDIVYKPHQTQWIKEAIQRGNPVIYGLEMLIEQGLLAAQIWWQLSDEQLMDLREGLLNHLMDLK